MKVEVNNLRKTKWIIPICIVFIIFIAFWGFKFWEHSSPQKAVGSKTVLGMVSFANGVVLITSDRNSLIKASYLTKGFLGWKVQKNTPTMQEVPSNNADISSTSMTINNHTFAWGTKKNAATDVLLKYKGKTYTSKGEGSIWYLSLPLNHNQYVNSKEFLKSKY
jgi:hypothetical protein